MKKRSNKMKWNNKQKKNEKVKEEKDEGTTKE